MANTIYNGEKVAAAALANIEASVVLAATVQKTSGAEFVGAAGHTVNIRRPSMLTGFEENIDWTAGQRLAGGVIKTESLNEQVLPVVLDTHAYSAVDLSDAELSLSLTSYLSQVIVPQTDALVNRLERKVAAALASLPGDSRGAVDISAAVAAGDYVKAAQLIRFRISFLASDLTAKNIPVGGRFLVLGSQIAGFLMNDPNLTQVANAGTDSALREAVIGKLYGFTLVQDNRVDPLTMYAYHPSVIQLVTHAPVVPESAKGASQSSDGYAIRAIKDYNSSTASERSFLSAYVGATLVTDRVRNADGSVNPTPSVIRGLKVAIDVTP